MSGSTADTKNAGTRNTDNKQRWAALDKRHERLFKPSDRALTDNDGKDKLDLKAAS